LKSFTEYLTEETKEVVFTFGRFNPPTVGHEKLISKVASLAKGNNYRVYASKSQDAKKNPLDFNTKVKTMRKMFPKHGRNIMSDKDVRNALDILVKLYDQGFTKVTMVVGSDRVNEFSALTNKYNGVKSRHGMYNFEDGINVVSAGERDPDADDVSGMSASKMRAAAADNDYPTFSKGLPSSFKGGKDLFDSLRKAMGIKEAAEYKNHVQLEPVSDLREAYIKQRIFEEGEQVVITAKGIVGTITKLGANYLVVESKGETWRCWLDQVSKVDPNEESILALASEVQPAEHSLEEAREQPKDKDSGMKKSYASGLSKSTNAKRAAQFKKQAKMDDDNPAAYKPAPGDATAKTKTSKHTKKFKDMYGEMKELEESNVKAALQKKADKTGMPYGILKKVFDRGVAAWRTGHRPGTNPTQWGLARVNSFATKSSGTWGGADKDLAAKVRG
jgi:nicotinamide mononucleotide adenylyltransferase